MVGSDNSSLQITWGDRTIAAVLFMTAVLGIIFNTVSLAYYPTRRLKRGKRQHNRNIRRVLHPAVYAVDLTICIFMISIAQSLLSNLKCEQVQIIPILIGKEALNRDGVNETLPSIPTLPPFSLYLVGVLSLCRQVVKFWKRAKLIPGIVCVFMVSYLVLSLCFEQTLLLTNYDEINLNENVDMLNRNQVIRRAVLVSQMIMSIVPITISFITHMAIYFCKANNKRRMDITHRASTTALVLTLIYAMAHITDMIDFLFIIFKWIVGENSVILSHFLLNKSVILLFCTWPRISVMIISINSLLSLCLKFMKRTTDEAYC